MSASTARHETRALLRAHLAAASAYGHLTRHCAVCHRLLRLAMEPGAASEPEGAAEAATAPAGAPAAPENAPGRTVENTGRPVGNTGRPVGNEDERPPATRPSAG
ncbi:MULTISPECIES: DUF6274 family protein [Streptomyces]|uniref:Uncharacterized protein n=1 Tax=Streptomyces badius TaxID=1941 RepID=A0ABQ2T3U8_STRBA|nr:MULTISPECIES: DUF6274 family protein [Streptomyces]GGS51773.1 hypothetical protein GCM10010253_27520 [Streptomyces badius]